MKKKEITIETSKLNGIFDAAGNLKDIYEELVATRDFTDVNSGGVRELWARNVVIDKGLQDVIHSLKPELTSMLPCVDLLRRAIEPPEENERYKREGFYDDEPYMEDRAA